MGHRRRTPQVVCLKGLEYLFNYCNLCGKGLWGILPGEFATYINYTL